MDTSINSFFGRIHPQGLGRRVSRYCVATLSLAASRARSLHVYLSDMLRRFLRGSLRCPRDTVGYTEPALWCGSAEQQACTPQMLCIAVSGLPSLKSELLEMPK